MKNRCIYIAFLISITTIAQVSDFKNIDFTIANNTAKLQEGAGLENLPVLAYNLTHNLKTDVEKFRAIYTWVCTNIKGDANQDNKVTKKRKKLKNDSLAYLKWNNSYKKIAFKKLLKKQKTMCTGYAYLIKELCFIANIECKIINGYGRSTEANVLDLELINHSWNAVKLNNKWYLCDATWSSGYMINYSRFVQDYNDGYFLTNPILFAKNHYPSQKKWLLDSTLIASKFKASPLVYGDTFTHKIIPLLPEEMKINSEVYQEIEFRFKTLKKISTDKVKLIQYSGLLEKPFKIYALKNENGILSFRYQFKQKGNYDVHLKLEEDIVATYIFEITKN
ncbi:transglutaminase domain-containing protein [Oceanihabitans sp. 2_MG-2023]|uniref:transglutaminase domain-containing protein n=1 Tax=Oceanihabitans sp. 2_MG-2023 TaxID=3062661 RepID=UPI0026E4099F|nr:transglutaminase domain-containing protein [Oceanihabitans sp. 2_MG-2023]MDO6597600.1 transglutaminase domain-containing protein [Oceanihabitans sp. 2_MG-2023]